MKTCLIGGGFIGNALARAFAERDAEVVVLNRRGRSETPGVRALAIDRTDAAAIRAAVEGADIVVDLIAYEAQDTLPLLAALAGRIGRYVLISSMDVYAAFARVIGTEPGPATSEPLTEAAPLRAKSFPFRGRGIGREDYDKIPLERAALAQTDLPATVLRLPMVFGPDDPRKRFMAAAAAMRTGSPLRLSPAHAAWRAAMVSVDDVGAAICAAALSPAAAQRVFNVGPSAHPTWREWLCAYAEAAGGALAVEETPDVSDDSADYSQHLIVDSSALRTTTGWRDAKSARDALAETAAADMAGV